MDFSKLKQFYYVAKEGSIKKASRLLNIDHSSLSRAIQFFEERMKTQLFIREARGVKLTHEGKRVFEFAQRFIHEAEILTNIINDTSSEPQGDLTIVTTPHMGSSWLMNYLEEYFEKHPKIKMRIIGRMERIDVTEADVAICTYIPSHPNLIQRHLKSFKMGLWVSPKYLKKYGEPKNVKDLDNHKIIAYGVNIINPYGNSSWILEVGKTQPFIRKPYLQINNLEGLLNATKEGIGIAELSGDWPSVKNSDLVNILPELDSPTVDLYYIYNESMKESKRVTSLADYLESKLKANSLVS